MHACRLVAPLVLGQVQVVYVLESSLSKLLESSSRVVGVVLCVALIHMGGHIVPMSKWLTALLCKSYGS